MKSSHGARNHRYAHEKTFLTPEKWFESETAAYEASGRIISRNVLFSRILRRVTDKRERFFVRKYLSRWFDAWKRRASRIDNDNAVISCLRTIIRYAVTVVGAMLRKVLSNLAITPTFDVVSTDKFLRLLVETYCSRHSTKHSDRCHGRYSTIAKRYSDRSFDARTSPLAHAVVKIAHRVPKTIVRSVDILKRSSIGYRDENYDWSYIRTKFLDAFSQNDDISRSKSDDSNVCATVTWNVIE